MMRTVEEMVAGDLVLLRRKSGLELSRVTEGPTESAPDWFHAATLDGKVRRFPTHLIAYGPFQGSGSPADSLEVARAALASRTGDVDLALLHDCTVGEPRTYGVDDLAELLLDEPDPSARAALFVALSGDDSPFERVDDGFVPLTTEALAARAHARAEAEAEEAEKKRRAEASRAKKRIERETLEPELKRLATGRIQADELGELTIEWLRGLREHLLAGPPQGSGDLAYGGELLRIRDEGHAVQLLARAGLWDPDREDVHALRAEIGKPYPEDVLAAADGCAAIDADARDLTSLHTVTIDGPRSRDLDDAVSLECIDEGIRLHVHIADVARWISPGSVLDRWGREVSESVYLPEATHHLYPEALVARTSLDPGVERGAVTMRALVTPAGEVQDVGFDRTIVCSDERLDYDSLDRLVRDDEAWARRIRVVEWLQGRRERKGARITLLPDLEVELRGNQIETRVSVTDTPSHRLVAELMILFNEQIGLHFSRNGVPAIFKTQPPDPTPPEFPDAGDPLYFPKIVRMLRPSASGLDPAPHAFIGVDTYCQATSPIRRYQDLVHQRQLLATLAGDEPPHSREELELLYPALESRGGEVRRVERRRRRFWVLRRLNQLRGKRLRGLVSQLRPGGRPVVFFPDFLIETGLLLPPDFVVEPGDEIYVTPQKVDAVRGGFWARPAG